MTVAMVAGPGRTMTQGGFKCDSLILALGEEVDRDFSQITR